jgi:hypothetical protein
MFRCGHNGYGFYTMMLQHISVWLFGRHYLGRWISRGPYAPVSLPPRPPDLNPIDFYLKDCVKNAVYAKNFDTRQQLWQCIQDAANEISHHIWVFKRVRASFRHRADACVHAHGGHSEHLLSYV